MMKKFVAIFVAVLMVATMLPSSFAANNKTIDQKSASKFAETLQPAQSNEKDVPSVEKKPVELSTGIDKNREIQSETVVAKPETKGATTLYGFDCYPGLVWVSMDAENPAGMTTVSEPSAYSYWAAEYLRGTIYAVASITDNAYEFGTVDKDTYVFTRISDVESTQGMAMDYSTGTMYAVCQGVLKTVDYTNGTFTTVATISGMGGIPIAMAIATDGTMYAIGLGEDGFYSIDKSTGEATLIGNTGIQTNYAQGATFDHASQTFYWASYSATGQLATVDVDSGTATVVGVFGTGSEVTCLMTYNDNVVLPDPVPVSGVELTPESATVVETRTLKLNATILPVGQYIEDKTCTWSSSNIAVARVSDSGIVTAFAPGETVITVRTNDGGFTDTSAIHVISLEEAYGELSHALNGEGENFFFSCDSTYPWEITNDGDRYCAVSTNHDDGSQAAVSLELENVVGGSVLSWDWKVSSEQGFDGIILVVNGETVTSLTGEQDWKNDLYLFPKSGNYVIEWYYAKDSSDSMGADCGWLDNVTFEHETPAAVEGVELKPSEATILVDKTYQLIANVLPINAGNANVTFTSSNTSVATVDENGIVTGKAVGEATITVTTQEGSFTDSSVISVITLPDPIPHTQMSYDNDLEIGGDILDFTLNIGSATRIFKPTSTGETSETITYGYGFSFDINEGEGTELILYSDTVDTCMWVFDTDFNTWAYNDDSDMGLTSYIKFVAPQSGTYYVLVTGFEEMIVGDVSIEALEYDPIRVTGVELNPETKDLGLGRYGSFTATVLPADADMQTCTWAISDPTVASIDAKTGRLYGLKLGSATVTVTTADGGFTDTATLNVVEVENPGYDSLLYGYSLVGANQQEEGFIKFDPTLGAEEYDIVSPTALSVYAGEYYDGLIYAYAVQVVFIFQIPNYYIIDPMDWSIQVQNSSITNVCYDMAYDYSTDTMYGVTSNEEGIRYLATVDMTNGAITMVAPIQVKEGEMAMNLACEFNGTLYTVSNAGTLYKIIDNETGETEDVGNIGYTLNYVQSMAFDRVSQKLYMAQLDDTTSRFLTIDKTTGSVIAETSLGQQLTEVTSLFAFGNREDMNDDPPVEIPAEGVSVDPEEATLEVGQSIKLKAVFTPANATNRKVTWASTSDSIATVDDKGNVTAVNPGSCYITLTTLDGGFTARALITVNVPPVGDLQPGYSRVTLTVPDVWGDGSGYQMLLDADHDTFGTTIPAEGALTAGGDVPQSIYDLFEYKIPENADGALATQNIVLNNTISVDIPAGTYDFCITNPTPGDRMWIATNGRADDFEMVAGRGYTFTLRLNGQNDMCDWADNWIGFVGEGGEYFTATFVNYDDSLIATSTVEKGEDALAPNAPIRLAYNFVGWDKAFTNMQADITVKAVYELDGDWCDVNGDGETNTGDAAMILRYVAQLDDLTPEQIAIADANQDGETNTGDAATILYFIAFGEFPF